MSYFRVTCLVVAAPFVIGHYIITSATLYEMIPVFLMVIGLIFFTEKLRGLMDE